MRLDDHPGVFIVPRMVRIVHVHLHTELTDNNNKLIISGRAKTYLRSLQTAVRAYHVVSHSILSCDPIQARVYY